MLHVQADRDQRRQDVQPVADAADPGIADLESPDPDQDHARDRGDQRGRQERQAIADRRLDSVASTRSPGGRKPKIRNGTITRKPSNRCRATMSM